MLYKYNIIYYQLHFLQFQYSGLTLADIGVTALPRFLWINNIDENIMASNRLVSL